MISSLIISISLSTLISAQYGRFPCTTNGVADQSLCTALIATGADSGVPSTSYKSDGFTPITPICVAEPNGGGFFCGDFAAPCNPTMVDVASNCDNGFCLVTDPNIPTVGTCQGTFGQPCADTATESADSACLGFIYCTSSFGAPTPSQTCGGLGAYCQDPFLAGNADPVAQAKAFDATCASTYCDPAVAQCAPRIALAADCTADQLSCVAGASCVNNICTANAVPSGAAQRARRGLNRRSNMCPESQTACSISGAHGYECIDTTTNLEQCGACATNGGLDCTTLPGVSAVGCVNSVCEIWACESGFAFDSLSSSCIVALVA